MIRRSERRLVFWFLAPAVLLYGVFFIYPAVRGLLDSLYDWQGLNTNKTFVGFANFERLWREFIDPEDFYGLRPVRIAQQPSSSRSASSVSSSGSSSRTSSTRSLSDIGCTA